MAAVMALKLRAKAPNGASTSVGLALLDAVGPSGTFQHRGEVLPW